MCVIQYHELIHELTIGVSASSLSSFPPLSPPLQGTKNAMKANISETSRKRTRKTTSPLLGSLKWSLQPTTQGWGDGKGWRWELSRSLRWSHLHWTKACVQIQQNTCLYIDKDVTIKCPWVQTPLKHVSIHPSIHPSIFSPIQSIHPRSISRRSMMRAKQIMNSIMKIVAATTSTKTPLKISARHAPEKTSIKVLIKIKPENHWKSPLVWKKIPQFILTASRKTGDLVLLYLRMAWASVPGIKWFLLKTMVQTKYQLWSTVGQTMS